MLAVHIRTARLRFTNEEIMTQSKTFSFPRVGADPKTNNMFQNSVSSIMSKPRLSCAIENTARVIYRHLLQLASMIRVDCSVLSGRGMSKQVTSTECICV